MRNGRKQEDNAVNDVQKDSVTLKGTPKLNTPELYLEQVQISSDMTNKDIADGVINYGQKKGIRILSCWVRRNRFNQETVGCKISVPASQADKCKGPYIWPKRT